MSEYKFICTQENCFYEDPNGEYDSNYKCQDCIFLEPLGKANYEMTALDLIIYREASEKRAQTMGKKRIAALNQAKE